MPYGWAGAVLFVDLSTRRTWKRPIEEYLEYVGGRGVNQSILFHMLGREVAPLDPEAPVILGAGPLVGTLVPAASRLAVDYKNVITGGVGSGNCGGHIAAELKYAGYDHVVITGRAAAPIYLYLRDGEVAFRDAGDLWGKSTWDTENAIKRAEGDDRIKTLAIGAAGENLVSFACLIGDRGRAVGYGGGGAIFGSKNLKAIAVRGTQGIEVAEPDRLLRRVREYGASTIERSEMVRVHRKGGTLLAYQLPGEGRPHGVRNMSDEFWPDRSIQAVSREVLDGRYLIRRQSCFGCPVFCSGIYGIGDQLCEGVQANSFRAFGSNLDVTDPETVVQAHALVNLHGLDADHASSAIAWAIECYEAGILTRRDTDGLELGWGKAEIVAPLIEAIAHRRGFGDVLAHGVHEAARIVGRGSERHAVVVKRNGLMEAAMRPNKAWALGIVTSTKGGGHLRGAIGKDGNAIAPEVSSKVFGIPDVGPITSYEHKAELVVWQEQYKAVIDMMGICALTSVWMDVTLYQPQELAEFYRLVTGRADSAEDLFRVGLRVHNLERVFNRIHAGFGREDDMPPPRLVDVPVSAGKFRGERLDLERWNAMLDEYYALHGWDRATGWPTVERLLELKLGSAVEILERHGMAARRA